MKRAVIRSLLLLPSPPVAAGCLSPTSKYKQNMPLSLKIFLLSILSFDVVFSENKVDNSTVISRREILEEQARTAYQNACYRLQELSNWMTAVFRIKGVWASATVNDISSRSSRSLTEADRRKMAGLPSRAKTAGPECSLSSAQVTAQTFAYLQSQLVMMKWLLGRNIFNSGKDRLGEAKERMKVLETFNSTLNSVVSKLKQNTENNTSDTLESEVPKARSTAKNIQEGRFFHIFRNPKTVLMSILEDQVMNNRIRGPTQPGNFFQNLGRNLDKLIFPSAPIKLDTLNDNSVASVEDFVNETEHSVISAEHSESKDSVPKTEQSLASDQHSVAKVSTSNAIMYSSIL